MITLIVLFNLQSDADVAAYEDWAKNTDLKTVRSLKNCQRFDLYRTQGQLNGDAAPYQYVEVINITDMDDFRAEDPETMKKVATEFRTFADNPIFMVSENIEA